MQQPGIDADPKEANGEVGWLDNNVTRCEVAVRNGVAVQRLWGEEKRRLVKIEAARIAPVDDCINLALDVSVS